VVGQVEDDMGRVKEELWADYYEDGTVVYNPSLDQLTRLIVQWGHQKGILPNGQAEKQFEKTVEEVAELKDAIAEKDIPEIADAIGDIVVTLIMQCEVQGLNFRQCVHGAYDVISKRTGKMIDGVFVKDS
jgi:NTP pyrophosphatase (non-canonical NTP hydrolase)